MKRVKLSTDARINGLESAKVRQAIEEFVEHLEKIAKAAGGVSTLDFSIVLRGNVQTSTSSVIVMAHEALSDALAHASDESVKSDLNIYDVREPRAPAEGETAKVKA